MVSICQFLPLDQSFVTEGTLTFKPGNGHHLLSVLLPVIALQNCYSQFLYRDKPSTQHQTFNGAEVWHCSAPAQPVVTRLSALCLKLTGCLVAVHLQWSQKQLTSEGLTQLNYRKQPGLWLVDSPRYRADVRVRDTVICCHVIRGLFQVGCTLLLLLFFPQNFYTKSRK